MSGIVCRGDIGHKFNELSRPYRQVSPLQVSGTFPKRRCWISQELHAHEGGNRCHQGYPVFLISAVPWSLGVFDVVKNLQIVFRQSVGAGAVAQQGDVAQ